MTFSETFKPTALFFLLVLAAMLRCLPAHAAPTETLTVAGGCFWCVESDFESVPGVIEAVSGFTGGALDNPTYKQVTGGNTGHYEAVEISFDPAKVSRETLLAMFLRSVDPTDAGGQFCDRGDSYRTAIFVSNAGEKALATRIKTQAQADLGQTIVTPVLSTSEFYPAEAYHQDYYKGSKLVFTRFGPKRQNSAYKAYRKACGRDARVKQLWGKDAPFTGS
ncbi:peptide-methionine (S)-S-oxide reductase [Phaeobacter gallaeciensis]|uniref:Peptide methionine sulfoxide reductase MsrA n=2 Tax=Roseobacteraceae TaxID=2854170 RepID=A0A366X0X4_9RHOB|nr:MULTISPECIES: peptide-methionine (S)-S-oxide reductase MsrA [Roseobacteraceae]MBT3142226.1 peptide-methionine (S)-S-oxide reductase MsrA [Falsiruegeria litorea]MBT8168429.1 peptide-methionine (S)-S-oxide reductase MsrA [Falsiruegeria litorea]RBW54082.1 peptide-methionine (S)-S-oxide reductase [Phaeobacter gallaeciensis]